MTSEMNMIRRSLEGASSFEQFRKNLLSCSISQPETENVEDLVSDVMFELGVPANIMGFRYLRRAICKVVEDENAIHHVFDGLYCEIAREFDTTTNAVERAIRHAIEVSYANGDIDLLSSYFGNTVSANKGSPTNSQFIAIVADKIRRKLKNRPQRCER